MKKQLGQGLSALLSKTASLQMGQQEILTELNIDSIEPNKMQPRKSFDINLLNELSASISSVGLIQPIIVQPDKEPNKYTIISGERRYRAAKMAGLSMISAIIKTNKSEVNNLEIAIIENIQRANLNLVDEAASYQKLAEDFGYTQDQIAKILGKSRSHISNIIRVNNFSDPIKDHIVKGLLTLGHLKALSGAEEPEKIAKIIITKELNVRQTEALCKNHKTAPKNQKEDLFDSEEFKSTEDLDQISQMLTEQLGFKNILKSKGTKYTLSWQLKDMEELDRLLESLAGFEKLK